MKYINDALHNVKHPYFADLYWFLQILCLDTAFVDNYSNDIMNTLLETKVNTLIKSKHRRRSGRKALQQLRSFVRLIWV